VGQILASFTSVRPQSGYPLAVRLTFRGAAIFSGRGTGNRFEILTAECESWSLTGTRSLLSWRFLERSKKPDGMGFGLNTYRKKFSAFGVDFWTEVLCVIEYCGPHGHRILLHSCVLSVVGDEDHKSYLIVSVLRGCYSQISKLEEVEYSSTFDLQIGVPSGFRYDGCRS
jgi:hypothetical protein